MNGRKFQVYFIINPASGKGKAESFISKIEAKINKVQFNYKFLVSQSSNDISKLTLKAVEEGADIIIAVGGDGTVNEVAQHIVNTDIILGIIPAGSGNGLANYLHIPADIDKALDKINAIHIKSIDTGTINSRFFVSVAGLGFDAAVAKGYAKSGKHGFVAYLNNCIKKYIRYKPAKYKIQFDHQIIARRALLITFANSDQFGYHTTIAPDAVIDDGYFNMCILKKVPLMHTPVVIEKLFRKKIHHSRYYESYRVKEATIYRRKGSVVNIDGEPVKLNEKTIHIINHKQSLKIIV
jgi:diacylglycerol kinase (ATP)